MSALKTHYDVAVALLEHADVVKDRENWHGDRDAYIQRTVSEALVYAVLDLSNQVRRIAGENGIVYTRDADRV